MGFFEIVLFSIALSIDALGIGISCELKNIRTPIVQRIVICIISVIITGAAIFLGSLMAGVVPLMLGKIIGAAILFILGGYIIIGALTEKGKKRKRKPKSKKQNILDFVIKPLGITVKIIRNPVECDIDGSYSIDMAEACYIGAAISADSFAAGLGAGVGGASGMIIPLMCGLCQMIFLCGGINIGKLLHNIKGIKQKYFGVISGIMLIIIAVFRIIF